MAETPENNKFLIAGTLVNKDDGVLYAVPVTTPYFFSPNPHTIVAGTHYANVVKPYDFAVTFTGGDSNYGVIQRWPPNVAVSPYVGDSFASIPMDNLSPTSTAISAEIQNTQTSSSYLTSTYLDPYRGSSFLFGSGNLGNWLVTTDDIVKGTNIYSTAVIEHIEKSSSDTSNENFLNNARMQRFQVEFTSNLLHLIREQDFEYGFYSPADELVRKCLKENEAVTKQWLNHLFITNYGNHSIALGILRVISHLEYYEIAPVGPTMAIAALAHQNSEIQECGIRAFENWSHPDSLRALKSVVCHQSWLNEYRQQVIADLTTELV